MDSNKKYRAKPLATNCNDDVITMPGGHFDLVGLLHLLSFVKVSDSHLELQDFEASSHDLFPLNEPNKEMIYV